MYARMRVCLYYIVHKFDAPTTDEPHRDRELHAAMRSPSHWKLQWSPSASKNGGKRRQEWRQVQKLGQLGRVGPVTLRECILPNRSSPTCDYRDPSHFFWGECAIVQPLTRTMIPGFLHSGWADDRNHKLNIGESMCNEADNNILGPFCWSKMKKTSGASASMLIPTSWRMAAASNQYHRRRHLVWSRTCPGVGLWSLKLIDTIVWPRRCCAGVVDTHAVSRTSWYNAAA